MLAYEIMMGTPAVRNHIREHATEQIHTVLQTGAQYGMCTMDASIKALYDRKIISHETAVTRMRNPAEFHMAPAADPTPASSAGPSAPPSSMVGIRPGWERSPH